MKAAVSPWDSSLVPVDVFRSPLSRAFSLLEEIRDHVHSDRYHFCPTATRSSVQLRSFCYVSVLPQSKHRSSHSLALATRSDFGSHSAALKQSNESEVRLLLGYRPCITSDVWFLSPPALSCPVLSCPPSVLGLAVWSPCVSR